MVPRERDMVRLYIPLGDQQYMDQFTGKVDIARVNPDDLLKVQHLLELILPDTPPETCSSWQTELSIRMKLRHPLVMIGGPFTLVWCA